MLLEVPPFDPCKPFNFKEFEAEYYSGNGLIFQNLKFSGSGQTKGVFPMSCCPGTKGKNTYVSGRTKALYKAGAVRGGVRAGKKAQRAAFFPRASSRLVGAGEEK